MIILRAIFLSIISTYTVKVTMSVDCNSLVHRVTVWKIQSTKPKADLADMRNKIVLCSVIEIQGYSMV